MLHQFDRSGTGVDVRRTQLRSQKMLAAEGVQRKVTVILVVTVEEPTFLLAVQRIVRSVQIDHDLLRRLGVGLQEDINKQRPHCLEVQDGLLVTTGSVGVLGRQLQTIQRALAGKRTPAIPPTTSALTSRLSLSDDSRQQRIA